MTDQHEQLRVDEHFGVDIIFKPDCSELRLTPDLTQLLLTKIEEILRSEQYAEELKSASEVGD